MPTIVKAEDFTTVSASLLFVVYILTQFLKTPLEALTKTTTGPVHDWAIRLSALVCSLAIVLMATFVTTVVTGPIIFNAVITAILGSVGAVGTYHLVADISAPTPKEEDKIVVAQAGTAVTQEKTQ